MAGQSDSVGLSRRVKCGPEVRRAVSMRSTGAGVCTVKVAVAETVGTSFAVNPTDPLLQRRASESLRLITRRAPRPRSRGVRSPRSAKPWREPDPPTPHPQMPH